MEALREGGTDLTLILAAVSVTRTIRHTGLSIRLVLICCIRLR
jgi:hypothetical protein